MTPFDFVKDITMSKNYIIEDNEGEYVPYITNRSLSYFLDTVIQANEMNKNAHLDKKLQFDYLYHSIRKGKRFSKWMKSETDENIEFLQKVYNMSKKEARSILPILSSTQIDEIKKAFLRGHKN